MKKLLTMTPLLLIACGEEGIESTTSLSGVLSPDTIAIAIADTIGVEFGDSTLVFGLVADAQYLPSGEIAVLDVMKACVQVFSPEGRETRRVGRRGAGPGELQIPVSLAVLPGGGLAVNDLVGGKLVFYDPDGVVLDEVTGYFPAPPELLEALDDTTLAAMFIRIEMGEDGITGSIELGRFSTDSEPELVYAEYPMSLDMPEGPGESRPDPEFDFACGLDGTVYLAERSDSMFVLKGFDCEGNLVLDVAREVDRVRIPEEERGDEASISVMIGEDGAHASTEVHPDPAEFRTVVESIGVDADGNIWLQIENTGETHFRVLDPSGELLAVALLSDPRALRDCHFSVNRYGMLAFEPDPADWPKVYLLEDVETATQ
ncbi:hypothetical protein JW921_10810 [Candidatus Fermentibacterales bacterium]|nr:hypothetical protein [Candidatus Fermentibacterales bacterium]